MLEALVCSGEGVNRIIAECSYLTQLFAAYEHGMRSYANHTQYFFESVEEFKAYNREIIENFIQRTAARLDNPSILALKDPLLTARFHAVAGLMPDTKFIIISRDPRDAVASRLRAQIRGQKTSITQAQIDRFCTAYNNIYTVAADLKREHPDTVCLVNYETLVDSHDYSEIERFLGTRLHPDGMWQNAVVDYAAQKKNAFYSELYGQPISATARGTYTDTISESQASNILETCAEAARRVGVPV